MRGVLALSGLCIVIILMALRMNRLTNWVM